ncbi:MAG: 4-(cytidine 5'-diphospho)-2-C-methyl-D-erythritol kinase [Pseudomonadota bacterium]
MIQEAAPAKINLYLHVGPVREDGFHELASLFVFAEDGDLVTVAPSDDVTLAITGPFAAALKEFPPEDNLVFKAAALLRAEFGVAAGAAITLDKRLPVAAGIGGGSADAAAALRALVRLWRLEVAEEALLRLAFALGADVPACLTRAPLNVTGAGECLADGPALPPLWICLINPRVAVSTGAIFRAFDAVHTAPHGPALYPSAVIADVSDLEIMASQTRNDLQPFAVDLQPEIADVLQFLAHSPDILMSRMSGSGATCFGLFASIDAAAACAEKGRAKGWWSMASAICHSSGARERT